MNKGRPWIAYVVAVAFPEGGAAARRILGNAQALVACGYDVVIVSSQPPGTHGSEFIVAPGIRCSCVNERNAEHLPKTLRNMRYAWMGARSRRWLKNQANQPVAVIVYSGYSPYLLQLTGWAQDRSIPIIFDAVEWYTAPGLPHFLASPYLWNIEFAMRFLIPRTDGVIAISKALEDYYIKHGLTVVRVPPLVDHAMMPRVTESSKDGVLRLAYSGTPGTKDMLDPVIRAVLLADEGSGSITLDVAGVTEEQLAALPVFKGDKPPETIRAHGLVSHSESIDLISRSDFTVFLRAVNRVSTCGFPTKFVESLSVGTPVITNLTSDLADHLVDGVTGFVCSEPEPRILADTLVRAKSLDSKAHAKMRDHARKEMLRAFDFRSHLAAIGQFMNNLQHKS